MTAFLLNGDFMKMYLYNVNDAENVINKNLVNGLEIDINLKASVDLVNPEIVLNGDFRGYNYVHLPDLNRYYFIERFEQLNLKMVQLYLKCDVLESYKSDILNSVARFKRGIKNGDYHNINIEHSNKMIVERFDSDGLEMDGISMIISVVGG